jgi:hypothetical protein
VDGAPHLQQQRNTIGKLTTHPTLPVAIDGEPVDIDTELAEMITECARLGVKTVGCCQDEGEMLRELTHGVDPRWECLLGRSYVEFIDLNECWRFHDLITAAEPASTLLSHITDASSPDAWEVRVAPVDGVAVGSQRRGGRFRAGVAKLRVPRSDIGTITACLQVVDQSMRRRRHRLI